MGAARAGFRVAAAVENDKYALETHSRNFPKTLHLDHDIGKLDGQHLLNVAGVKDIDGLIGGPPCQGFSFMGRRDEADARNSLFSKFFCLVADIGPKFFLAENVPGILSPKYDEIRNKALSRVSENYIVFEPLIVKASDYGAPTTRTRVFFIGYKTESFNRFDVDALAPPKEVVPTFVRDALRGLPRKIAPEWQSESDGWRKVRDLPDSLFYRKVSSEIPAGVGDPKAIETYLNRHFVSGCMGTVHTAWVRKRYEKVQQGRQDKISKAPRLHPKCFCPTLRAGTGSDKGSYQAVRPIHPYENRVITPREAARLQGFPDWFVFHRTKWHSFRQIGNSVSPIVAETLLSAIKVRLKTL